MTWRVETSRETGYAGTVFKEALCRGMINGILALVRVDNRAQWVDGSSRWVKAAVSSG